MTFFAIGRARLFLDDGYWQRLIAGCWIFSDAQPQTEPNIERIRHFLIAHHRSVRVFGVRRRRGLHGRTVMCFHFALILRADCENGFVRVIIIVHLCILWIDDEKPKKKQQILCRVIRFFYFFLRFLCFLGQPRYDLFLFLRFIVIRNDFFF